MLRSIKTDIGLINDDNISLASILGTGERGPKLSLALNCELLQRIISQGGKTFYPLVLIKAVTKSILLNEPMSRTYYDKLKVLATTG